MSLKIRNIFLFLFFINFIYSTYGFKSSNNFIVENFGFEKSVEHILRTEMNETGNSFVILYHSFERNDKNLNALIGELNKNRIPLIIYTKIMVELRFVFKMFTLKENDYKISFYFVKKRNKTFWNAIDFALYVGFNRTLFTPSNAILLYYCEKDLDLLTLEWSNGWKGSFRYIFIQKNPIDEK